jgi:hypothetical protein
VKAVLELGNKRWWKRLPRVGSNAKVETTAELDLKIEVEHLSFKQIGFGQVAIHGLVQLNVVKNNEAKKYCLNLSDKDNDNYSPLKWYSFDTRIGASRKMASAAMRKAVDQIIEGI